MYKSGLTQLIRWRLRTGIPRRAGVVGQLVFFWAFPNMTWMDQRPTLGFGIGGQRLIQVQYTSGSLVAFGQFWALTLRLCLFRRAEIEDGLVVGCPC
jgi:hypothetical protein